MACLADMASAIGLQRKPFYSLSEIAAASGIAYSTLYQAAKYGTLKAFVPPGKKRGMLVNVEWFDEWISEGSA